MKEKDKIRLKPCPCITCEHVEKKGKFTRCKIQRKEDELCEVWEMWFIERGEQLKKWRILFENEK